MFTVCILKQLRYPFPFVKLIANKSCDTLKGDEENHILLHSPILVFLFVDS